MFHAEQWKVCAPFLRLFSLRKRHKWWALINLTNWKSNVCNTFGRFITLRSRVQIPVSLHENQGLTLNRGSFVVFAWGFYSKFRYVKMTILYLSILVSLFWLASRFINLYQFALVGAIFEILWLPMILMVFCLPLISFYYLFKEKFSVNSTYLYAILIMIFTFLIILFFN